MTPGPDRLKSIRDLIVELGHELPKQAKHGTSAKLQQRTKRQQAVIPTPDMYQVIEGVLCNEDKTPATALPAVDVNTTGFVLSTPEAAQIWLDSDVIAKDELALVVLGNLGGDTKLDVSKHTIPLCDHHGRMVLMACTLVQLGQKHIIPSQRQNAQVEETQASIVSITMWAEDWESNWDTITRNPAAWIRSHAGTELIAIWGKSFRKGRQPSSAQACTSVQMHATVKTDLLPALLAKSGTNRIFLVPKTTDGKICSSWKLIWLEHNVELPQAQVIIAKVPQSAGYLDTKGFRLNRWLVRIKGRFALRVPASVFQASWRLVYPNQKAPSLIETTKTYKIDNLPYGTTAASLLAWATSVKWTLKPLRPVGPRGWMVGTPSDPPCVHLAYNSSPLLIRELRPTFMSNESPIVAGPRPATSSGSNAAPTKTASLPPLATDPWAGWQGTQAASAQQSRAMPGPIESKFVAQEDRITRLEATIGNIAKQQDQTNADLQTLHTNMGKQEEAQKAYIDNKFIAFRQDLETSFSKALQEQSKSFDSNLQDIKHLILSQQAKRKTPQEGDDDMDG
eukprot:Skav203973  [mRNA]  locus=scaffold94:565464:567158:+ [translate_table: standard]